MQHFRHRHFEAAIAAQQHGLSIASVGSDEFIQAIGIYVTAADKFIFFGKRIFAPCELSAAVVAEKCDETVSVVAALVIHGKCNVNVAVVVEILAPHIAYAAVLDKQLLRIRTIRLVNHQVNLALVVVKQHIVEYTVVVEVALVDFAFLGACVVVVSTYVIQYAAHVVVDKVGYAVLVQVGGKGYIDV